MRDHRWTPDRMSDYLGNDLAPEDRRRVERHTEDCAECAQVLKTLEALITELRGVRDTEGNPAAESLLQSVLARLDDPLEQS